MESLPIALSARKAAFLALAMTTFAISISGSIAPAATNEVRGKLYHSLISRDVPNGALIFRQGTGEESHIVRAAQGGGSWTHVGILSSGPLGVTVIHAVPAEEAGQADVVKEDTLKYFLDPKRAVDAQVMAVDGARAADSHAAVSVARELIGRPFGIHAVGDVAQDGAVYCTELVIKAWQTAGFLRNMPTDQIGVPFFTGDYLLPSSLARSHALTIQ